MRQEEWSDMLLGALTHLCRCYLGDSLVIKAWCWKASLMAQEGASSAAGHNPWARHGVLHYSSDIRQPSCHWSLKNRDTLRSVSSHCTRHKVLQHMIEGMALWQLKHHRALGWTSWQRIHSRSLSWGNQKVDLRMLLIWPDVWALYVSDSFWFTPCKGDAQVFEDGF